MQMPNGELYINEVKRENSIAFIDRPNQRDIDRFFRDWKKAEKIIYVENRKVVKVYTRQ